jgi:hypothetical protein
MSTEIGRGTTSKRQPAKSIAAFVFLLQFFFFMYNYNFNGILFLTWLGWLMLIPGFLLVSLKKQNLLKIENNKTHLRNSFSDGWILMSIAFAMISQYWLNILFMAIQLPLVIFSVYNVEFEVEE